MIYKIEKKYCVLICASFLAFRAPEEGFACSLMCPED
jgi:hypothetical protein